MSSFKLTEITCYPINGMQGFHQREVNVTNRQLSYTNTLYILQIDGTQLSNNAQLKLNQLYCRQDLTSTTLSNLNGDSLSFEHTVFHINNIAPLNINRWLSEQLNCDVQLFNHPLYSPFPFHATRRHSLECYQLSNQANHTISTKEPENNRLHYAYNTKPHFKFDSATAWIEKKWDYLKIGEVLFKVMPKLTSSPSSPYLNSLIYPINDGIIQLGDPITPLIKRHPISMQPFTLNDHPLSENITVTLNQTTFLGNTQHTLLEQCEAYGLTLPYSCRAGICKQCCVTLIKGEVKSLNHHALQPNNKILSCSCIPLSHLEISLEEDQENAFDAIKLQFVNQFIKNSD